MTRRITVHLTLAEARALSVLAEEGACGLLTDSEAAKAYVGPRASQDAARRAMRKLGHAIYPREA